MAEIPPGLDLRIVMIGKTGVGKSAVGNTILGMKKFTSCPSATSVTKECEKYVLQWGNRQVCVVDTPGILDTDISDEAIVRKIVKCVKMSCPGPHVFLLVVQVGRFTREEKNSVEALQQLFGPKVNQYMIVLFTRTGELDGTLDSYVLTGGRDLQGIVRRCGSRYHGFENTSKDRNQVVELIKKIDQMVAANGASYYTDAMYQEVHAAPNKDISEYSFVDKLLQCAITFLEYLFR